MAAKASAGLTFAEIAEKVGRHEVWTTAAIFGQAQMDLGEAQALAELLELGPEVTRSPRSTEPP